MHNIFYRLSSPTLKYQQGVKEVVICGVFCMFHAYNNAIKLCTSWHNMTVRGVAEIINTYTIFNVSTLSFSRKVIVSSKNFIKFLSKHIFRHSTEQRGRYLIDRTETVSTCVCEKDGFRMDFHYANCLFWYVWE